jgi:hypothetical protein
MYVYLDSWFRVTVPPGALSAWACADSRNVVRSAFPWHSFFPQPQILHEGGETLTGWEWGLEKIADLEDRAGGNQIMNHGSQPLAIGMEVRYEQSDPLQGCGCGLQFHCPWRNRGEAFPESPRTWEKSPRNDGTFTGTEGKNAKAHP